jgi:hypothetical protein
MKILLVLLGVGLVLLVSVVVLAKRRRAPASQAGRQDDALPAIGATSVSCGRGSDGACSGDGDGGGGGGGD